MKLGIFFRSLVACSALSLLAYAVLPGASLGLLAKMLAASLGVSLLAPFIYTHVRGVQNGDRVVVVAGTTSSITGFVAKHATALEKGHIGKKIRVALDGGPEMEATVDSYSGILSPARVSLSQKDLKIL
ncbi:Uncharacterised protein [Candidatus Anstonella stagnisolia]|nr:Uncharacterised protein [Candidatus Anstonella stagnisolia]